MGFIFAGCGGTFWTATPFLAALVRKYRPDLCAFVDPDFIEAGNLNRQWVNETEERAKATLARAAVMGPKEHAAITDIDFFPKCTVDHKECWKQFDGMDTVVITNVDSNQARLDIRRWCRGRPGFSAMIVSGCDTDYGQVYWGAWKDQDAIYDFLPSHPDLEQARQPTDACGQNIMSNAQTGVFLGWALDDVMRGYADGCYPFAREYYWKLKEGRVAMMRRMSRPTVKAWTEQVPARGDWR